MKKRLISRTTGQDSCCGIIAGLILLMALSAVALLPIMQSRWKEAEIRSQVSRVKGDMRSNATAIEAYYVDSSAYPCWVKGESGANSFAGPEAGVYHIHTFQIWKNPAEVRTFNTLTTPISYLAKFFTDPFADTRGATFGYYCDVNGWVIYSWGPDRDENKRDSWDLEPDVEKVYRSTIAQPSPTLLFGSSSSPAHEAYTYDPSNGTVSPGDIWRVKQ